MTMNQTPMNDEGTITAVLYATAASIFTFLICVGVILFYWGNK